MNACANVSPTRSSEASGSNVRRTKNAGRSRHTPAARGNHLSMPQLRSLHTPTMELHAELTRHAETAETVEAALSRLEPAPGWRVLRAPGRLEAH